MQARTVIGSLSLAGFVSLAGVLALSGCSDKVDNAVEAAKQLSQMGEQAKQVAEAAQKAAEAAKQAAAKQVAAGTDPNAAQQQVDLAGTLAGLQAMGAAGGPVVNWRELSPFVPEKIGGFDKHGELDGSTNNAGGFQVTKVERHYRSGEQKASIEITDANMVQMLKMPFAMSALINEDSTRGFKKGKRIGDHPAIVEWDESSKRSKVMILVGERYIVEVRVSDATANDAAEKLAAALDIAGLAKLKPAETAAAPAAPTP